MKNNNILVAFANSKVSDSVKKMLDFGKINTAFCCTNGSELKRQLAYYNGGIIICGFKLKDMTVLELIEDIPDDFAVILIGNLSQIEMCDSSRVFKLAVPLQKSDLIYSVSMLMNMHSNHKFSHSNIRSSEENILIENAKKVLIDKYSMTEEQAYRYIQKKSMDSGTKMGDISRIILN